MLKNSEGAPLAGSARLGKDYPSHSVIPEKAGISLPA
jgi:hypothetical protein